MGQSDRDMCLHTLRLTSGQPKSVFTDRRQKPSPGDPVLKKKKKRRWLRRFEQPLGQAVANARCHARTWPVEKGSPVTSADMSSEGTSCLALPRSFCLSLFSELFSFKCRWTGGMRSTRRVLSQNVVSSPLV